MRNKPTKISDVELLELIRKQTFRPLKEVACSIGIPISTLRNRIARLKEKGLVQTTYKFFPVLSRVYFVEESK
jgi:DNA-binding Lrp family transcriptional regulator